MVINGKDKNSFAFYPDCKMLNIDKTYYRKDAADRWDSLLEHVNNVKDDSLNSIDGSELLLSRHFARIPLFVNDNITRLKMVPDASGLNWGNTKGHSRLEGPMEAYIPIKKSAIEIDYSFIPAKGPVGYDMKINSSIYVDLLWDDGNVMLGVFSGNGSKIHGLLYPKQLTTSGSGAILGGYLRNRLGVACRHVITYQDLAAYGRDTIDMYKLDDRTYYLDFSV